MSNVFFTCPEFYLSYQAKRTEIAKVIDDLLGALGQEVYDGPETAIVVGRKFYILKGDHREALLSTGPNLSECVAYFLSNQDKIAPTSNRPVV